MLITCPKCSVKYKVPSEITLKKGKKVQCSACEHIFEFVPTEPEEIVSKEVLLPPQDAVLSIHSKTERVLIHTKEMPDSSAKSEISPLPEAFRPVEMKTPSTSYPFLKVALWGIVVICLLGSGWLGRDLLKMNMPSEKPVFVKRQEMVPTHFSKKHTRYVAQNTTRTGSTTVEAVVNDLPPKPVVTSGISVQSVRFRKTPTGAVLIEGTLKNVSSEVLPVPEKIYALGYGKDGSKLFEKEIYLPTGTLYPNMEQAFFGTYTSMNREVQWVDVILNK